MFKLMFLCYTVMTTILTSITTMQCLPIQRMDNSSSSALDRTLIDQPVIMSKELRMQLTNKLVNSSGLFSLWLNANALTKSNILKTKVRSIAASSVHMRIYAQVYLYNLLLHSINVGSLLKTHARLLTTLL